MERYAQIINIALEAVFANKFRSVLTALGIIFGVAAVIAMMAIGNGAQKEILDQIKLVGVNNIIITPVIEKSKNSAGSEEEQGRQQTKKFSPGLSMKDVEAIKNVIPTIDKVCPEVIYETYIIKEGIQTTATLSGVTPDYFDVFNLKLRKGLMFTGEQMKQGDAVCIIGPTIASKFFPNEDPINKHIKCGNLWLKVIGVLESRKMSDGAENLGISNTNVNIYAPINTIFLRYKDRSVITKSSLQENSSSMFFIGGMVSFSSSSSGAGDENKNIHQVDKVTVQVKESSQLRSTVQLIRQMLVRLHSGVEDFKITVPELLLKQEQRTKDIFNIVLGAIASISLIVGGIGIMNIMLASVMERIREIGVRRATGATKRDIVFQFLAEATLISITGGLIGIILGIVFSKIIMKATDILTIVSPVSIIVSFGVSVAVGIVFGYMPAKRAAEQDPVESLRHD